MLPDSDAGLPLEPGVERVYIWSSEEMAQLRTGQVVVGISPLSISRRTDLGQNHRKLIKNPMVC